MSTPVQNPSRAAQLSQARRAIVRLDALARRNRLLEVELGEQRLAAVRVAELHLTLTAANVLEAVKPAARPDARWRGWLRALRRALPARTADGGIQAAHQGQNRGSVLLVPREPGHLSNLLPVASALSEAIPAVWLTFRSPHQRWLEARGQAVLTARAALPPTTRWSTACAELEGAARAAAPPAGMEPEDWQRIVPPLVDELRRLLPTITRAVRRIALAFDSVSPGGLLVGNCFTLEGRAAVEIAHRRGIPSATVQHGMLSKHYTLALDSPVDRYYAWGIESAKTIATASGIPQERIVCVGPPWLETLELPGRRRKSERRRVLVALSGSGHQVAHAEHVGVVRRLFEATARTPACDWVFRVHRKDDPRLYRQIKRMVPGARGTILSVRSTDRSLIEEAAACDVLVTVASTAALEAMLVGTPVVTLSRSPGEHEADFVTQRATIPVSPQDAFEQVVESVAIDGAPEEVRRASQNFLKGIFGPRDGSAGKRAAADFLGLIHTSARAIQRNGGEAAR